MTPPVLCRRVSLLAVLATASAGGIALDAGAVVVVFVVVASAVLATFTGDPGGASASPSLRCIFGTVA
eukprot:5060129-Alexandrium_andersonii.AAC.1